MADTPDFLAERMRVEGEKTVEFFSAIAPENWEQTVYTDGSCWAVRQVLAHFVSTEAAIGRLIENIRAGGSGVSNEFDINAYNERKVASLRQVPPPELLLQFVRFRQRNIEVVSMMTQVDLARQGRHPFLGQTELVEIIKLLYRHNQIHQRDIRKHLAG
jgi:DinB superfamily